MAFCGREQTSQNKTMGNGKMGDEIAPHSFTNSHVFVQTMKENFLSVQKYNC